MPRKKLKNKQLFFDKIYRECWNYIKEIKNFVYISLGIFIFFLLIGFFVPVSPDIKSRILQFLQELLSKTQGLSQTQLITFIFFNNLQTSFLSTSLGIILGVFPIITSVANGYIVGFVSAAAVNKGGVLVLWRLFPHGIFELPALFISLGMGMKLGVSIFEKNWFKNFGKYLLNSIKVFVFVVIPLLLIAAIIEGTLIYLTG